MEKTLINSALVSAQNRNRYYWTNFEVTQPEDKGILLKDIIEGEHIDLYDELENDIRNGEVTSEQKLNGISQTMKRALNNGKNPEQKANSLTACAYKGMGTNGMTNVLIQAGVQKDNVVVLRPCERIKDGNDGHIATATDIRGMDCIKRVYGADGKAPTLTTMGGGHREPKVMISDVLYRKLTPLECERLQTFPDNWTDCISNTQRYKSLGNAWTIDVIAHILKCI